MKLQAILSALLLVAASSLSFTAYAATDADKAQATEVQAAKPAPKKMKRHSHMQDKTNMAPSETDPKAAADKNSDKPTADKDKTKHYHPRDGK